MGAPECRDLEPLLQPYVDGEFEPGDRADVETHLAHCPACRTLVEGERRLRVRMREALNIALAPARASASGVRRNLPFGLVPVIIRHV